MRRKKARRGFTSIKENAGMHQAKLVKAKMNLGKLMRENPQLEDYLFSLVTNTDWVFDDMDLSIEEFSDISGVDLEEILEELNVLIKTR